MIRNESDILNVVRSEERCKRPSGVRGGAPEQNIHIDDFPLNGHPPSCIYGL